MLTTIDEVSQLKQWKYVDTGSNPADDASRGLSAEELIHSKRWLSGPAFLWKEQKNWPIVRVLPDDDPEVKIEGKSAAVAVMSAYEDDPVDRIIRHHSSCYRLKKCIAWILRYRQSYYRHVADVKKV